MHVLLVATHNPGKVAEYRDLLADLPLRVTSLAAEHITHEVAETGATFAENAILKARAFADRTGLWTWADDSGLEVDALGGRPGVLSARYGGEGLSDEDRYRRLLSELKKYPKTSWTARFRCVVAIAQPNGIVRTATGSVEGHITDRPRGVHGFGYDPIFQLRDESRTMAELPAAEKNRISHRARAAAGGKEILQELLQTTDIPDKP